MFLNVLAVQTTSGANITSRIEKSMGKKELFIWLKVGNQFEVHGWRKMGKRGARKLWQVDRRKILKEMLH